MITCPKAVKRVDLVYRLASLHGFHGEYGIEQEEKREKDRKKNKEKTNAGISKSQGEILQCLLVRFPQPPKTDRRCQYGMYSGTQGR